MISSKIRKVGNSAVMTLTAEMLAILDAKEGDTLFVVRGDDGSLRIMANDPELGAALEVGETVMDENRDLLQALA
jgi:putative addiction module antidote